MGLDMYLYKEVFIGAEFEHRKVKGIIDLTADGKPIKININKVSIIKEQAGYWRKANHIHKWFVDNVQEGNDDCDYYYVEQEKLKELKSLCEKILANGILSKNLLPTQEGFFFGSTDYDKFYFEDLEATIKILSELDPDGEYYYRSSW